MSGHQKVDVARIAGGGKGGDVYTDWNTPPALVDLIRKALGGRIDLDPCSNAHSVVNATRNIIPPADGLAISWKGSKVYFNPPYGRGLVKWVSKGIEARAAVGLIPSATDTKLWHQVVFPFYHAVCFIEGRIRFLREGSVSANPSMPVAIIYRGADREHFRSTMSRIGRVVLP